MDRFSERFFEKFKVSIVLVLVCFFLFSFTLLTEYLKMRKEIEVLQSEKETLISENHKLLSESENYKELYSDYVDRVNLLNADMTDCLYQYFSEHQKYLEVKEILREQKPELYSWETVLLLAKVCEAEAGIGKSDGIKAVCKVILNRVDSDKWPDTIEQVVYQRGQFEVIRHLRGTVEKETLLDVMEVLLCGYDGIDSEMSFHAYTGSGSGKVIDGNLFY